MIKYDFPGAANGSVIVSLLRTIRMFDLQAQISISHPLPSRLHYEGIMTVIIIIKKTAHRVKTESLNNKASGIKMAREYSKVRLGEGGSEPRM